MELNKYQEEMRDKACELLYPYCKDVEIDRYPVFFRLKNSDGDEVGEITCSNRKCIDAEKHRIREYIGKGKHLYEVQFSNDGDHDCFEFCCICGERLNEFLSYIDSEIQHFEEYMEDTKEDIIDSSFELYGMLYSTHWSCDSDYHKNLADRVTKLSERIITVLSK